MDVSPRIDSVSASGRPPPISKPPSATLSTSLVSPTALLYSSSTAVSSNYVARKAIAFFIFDPTLKSKVEKPTEEKQQDAKLIYYHPSYKVPEEKRRHIGVIEGIITFAKLFAGAKNPLQSINTKQNVLIVKEWEPNIWVTLVFKNPHIITMKGSSVLSTEWIEHQIQESVYEAVLLNLCSVFHLLHGKIKDYLVQNKNEHLKNLLEDFIPAFFETVDGEYLSITKGLEGFHFGPISHGTILSIQSYVAKMKALFPTICDISLLFDGYLIYNGMSQEEMLILYSYLVCYNGTVDSMKLNNFPFGRIVTAASEPGGGSSAFGRANFLQDKDGYLFGSYNSNMFVPKVYFKDGVCKKLVVLLYKQLMLILLFHDSDNVTDTLLNAIREAAVAVPGGLKDLFPFIAEQVQGTLSREDNYRFIYFNNANKAIRISNHRSNSSTKDKALASTSEMQLLGAIHESLSLSGKPPADTIHHVAVKAANSGWVLGTSSLDREYFLLLDNAKASFTEAEEETATFTKIHFSNICI